MPTARGSNKPIHLRHKGASITGILLLAPTVKGASGCGGCSEGYGHVG